MVTKITQSSSMGENERGISKSYKKIMPLVKSFPFGVGVTNAKKGQILEFTANFVKKTTGNCYFVTPNPEMIVLANKKNSFKSILNAAEVALCDGIGVSIACKMLGIPLQERITGVEFMENVCEQAKDWQITVGFLGGRGGVAEKTAECLQKKYPGLVVSYVGEEWNSNMATSKVDILFVAFGFPKQEEWMAEHVNKIPARIMVGVGGAFDYISGKVPRAPAIIRAVGLEWLFRLIVQPWRIKRQIALLEFIYLVLKEKI